MGEQGTTMLANGLVKSSWGIHGNISNIPHEPGNIGHPIPTHRETDKEFSLCPEHLSMNLGTSNIQHPTSNIEGVSPGTLKLTPVLSSYGRRGGMAVPAWQEIGSGTQR